MQDRNVIGAATAAFISPFVDFYSSLAPFLILAIILIFVDMRFGIFASRKRGELIRPSRVWRRSINKLVDYICWVTLAGMIGQTFGTKLGIPTLSIIVLCVVYAIEVTSIFNNYFEYKGIKTKFSFVRIVDKIFGKPTISDCIEDEDK